MLHFSGVTRLGKMCASSFVRFPRLTANLRFKRMNGSVLSQNIAREQLAYDVVIVGAGCAGLSAAIRLKTLAEEKRKDLSVCIIEKGESIGSHILSGCLLETSGLSKLLPNWREMDSPIIQTVKEEGMQFILGQENSVSIPHWVIPRNMRHKDNYIVSLSNVCRWMAEIAEKKGVDIFSDTGVAGLIEEDGKAVGVFTKDKGIDKNGQSKLEFQRGYAIYGKTIILAEGALGSVTEEAIQRFNLSGKCDRTFGLGIKEIWEIPGSESVCGKVVHTVGYPLQRSLSDSVYGGGFVYFQEPNIVHVGYITGLDYRDPNISPYEEFQLFKKSDFMSSLLLRGERIEYGARVIYEGGLLGQCKPVFPGGIIAGESLGVMDMSSLQGGNNSIESGIIAADSVMETWDHVTNGSVISRYEENLNKSDIVKRLSRSRSYRAMFEKGLFWGMSYAFICGSLLFNHCIFTHSISKGQDWEKTKTIDECKNYPSRDYEKADNIVSFERVNSLSLSCINYPQNELTHIAVKRGMESYPYEVSLRKYNGPEQLFCPANVYEYVTNDHGIVYLQINHENCIHCKSCVAKTPGQYIEWIVPSSGGPNYSNM